MPWSGNKENLFGIDFDIDISINIEAKHKKSTTLIKAGDKHHVLFKGMTRKDFSSWNLSDLQEYLADCGINESGNKDTFVKNPCYAYIMNLQISVTDYKKEKNEVKMNLQLKLVLENGLVSLPDLSD